MKRKTRIVHVSQHSPSWTVLLVPDRDLTKEEIANLPDHEVLWFDSRNDAEEASKFE